MRLALKKHSINKFLKLAGVVLLAGSAYVCHNYLNPDFYLHGQSMYPTITPGKVYTGSRLIFSDTVERNQIVAISPEKLSHQDVEHPDGLYIKRIVGLPGDTLTFTKDEGNLIAINGQPLNIKPATDLKSFSLRSKRDESFGESISGDPYKYSDQFGASYFIYQSTKSQAAFADGSKAEKFADVIFNMPFLNSQPDMDGKVSVTVPEGFYFALSDNRTVGTDSRHYGFVPEDSVKAYLEI